VPLSGFFSGIKRFAGEKLSEAQRGYGQLDKNVFGGVLPGGAASPLSEVKGRFNQARLDAAGSALNTLPDRVNLFTRYMTGVGNSNLQLDESTLNDLRRSTEKTPVIQQEKKVTMLPGNVETTFKFEVPTYGPGFPESGPVNPYGIGTASAPKSVTNTLGRFNATVDARANTIRIQDKYDMVNESEDPDLVSGKFQPQKAWNEIESIWNPAAGLRNLSIKNKIFAPEEKQYNPKNVQKALSATGESPTYSPATRFARALMYVSTVKPKAYDVNITIPMEREIQ